MSGQTITVTLDSGLAEHLFARCTESTNAPKINGYSCEQCRAVGEILRGALDSSEQAPTREGGDAHARSLREGGRTGGHVAEAASGGPSGAASLNSHPAVSVFGFDYWDEPGAGGA